MKLNNIVYASLLMLSIWACQDSNTQSTATTETLKTEATTTESKAIQYGDAITADGAISFDEMLTKMPTTDTLQTKVRGKVSSVCQVKGCWMTVQAENGEEIFVKFKDYAFFMPKDLTGKEAIMEGEAYYEETSVEELRHYAEDEGKSVEEIAAITEPTRELKFMASGVLVP